MLISPPEKTSLGTINQSNNSVTATSNGGGANRTNCDTEISIDLSRIPVETTTKTKKNITIQITSLNDNSSVNNTQDPSIESVSSPVLKDKLIRLKIKMPKSPKGNSEIKRERSFFTEKDFSTLPKEFIKFANSMICGDDLKKETQRTNFEAKNRYCDKSLNDERRANNDMEKEFGAISPIMHDATKNILSSTLKEEEEVTMDNAKEQKRIQPLDEEFQGVKICEVVEKKCHDSGVKPYEDILAKLKPYSKYRMQYLHNLRKLQSKECEKSRKGEFCLSPTGGNPANVATNRYDFDENELLQMVNQSTKYRPLMGKNALFSKMVRKYEDDSEIVKELVTDKFSPFFERRRRERRENANNYSLPIDNIAYDKDEKLQKIHNKLNQTVHRIVVNDELYAVISKNNNLKELDIKPVEEEETKNNPSYQEVDAVKPIEISSYSDYDIEKFLQNAIGDVGLLSQTMDTSRRRLEQYPEDHSIATGEMSLLVSKASSISTFCSTIWRRMTRRNSTVAPQESDEDNENEEQIRKEERNKRIVLLNQEASVQNEIIRQASKALDYCEQLPGVDFLSQRIEAERVILIATHKNKMIQHEIEDVTYYSTIRSSCSYLGSFAIRNLQFRVKDVCPKQEDCSQWYVCVVNRGTEISASTAVQATDDGNVAFKEEFSFDFLPPDFEIGVSVFTLKVIKHKDRRSSFQRMKFFSFRRDAKPIASRKTLTSRFSRSSIRSPNKEFALQQTPIRQSSFLFLGETTVTIKDVDRTNLTLTNIANFANILESFTASMSSSVNIDECFSDFLNIGTESGEKTTWNRRWCTLQNTKFKYWNSPSDEETEETPLKTIDLAYSVRNVAMADRSICPRAKTLQLEVLIPLMSKEDGSYTVERYFLTADTTESMHNWEKYLNSIITTLRAWNCLISTVR